MYRVLPRAHEILRDKLKPKIKRRDLCETKILVFSRGDFSLRERERVVPLRVRTGYGGMCVWCWWSLMCLSGGAPRTP